MLFSRKVTQVTHLGFKSFVGSHYWCVTFSEKVTRSNASHAVMSRSYFYLKRYSLLLAGFKTLLPPGCARLPDPGGEELSIRI